MEWKLPKKPSPKKTKASRSAVKVMLTVFWDAEGIILADFCLKTQTCTNSTIINYGTCLGYYWEKNT